LRSSIPLVGLAIDAALSEPVAHGLPIEADEPSRLGEVPAGLLVRTHDAVFDEPIALLLGRVVGTISTQLIAH
jgi:hypothetical protein